MEMLRLHEQTGHERSNEGSDRHLPDDLDHDGGIYDCGNDAATVSRPDASRFLRTGIASGVDSNHRVLPRFRPGNERDTKTQCN